MTAKQYLNQLRGLEASLSTRQEEVKRLQESMTFIKGVSYDRDRVQSSASHNASYERLVDIVADVEHQVAELAKKRHVIIAQIEGLERPEYVEILLLRYVERQRFEAIACAMGFSYAWVIQLHGIALQAFQKKYLTNV